MADEAKKALSSLELLTAAIGLIKSGALIFGMVLIDWAIRRQKLAENKQAVAESELEVYKQKEKIQGEANSKHPSSIVDEYLNGPDAKGD